LFGASIFGFHACLMTHQDALGSIFTFRVYYLTLCKTGPKAFAVIQKRDLLRPQKFNFSGEDPKNNFQFTIYNFQMKTTRSISAN